MGLNPKIISIAQMVWRLLKYQFLMYKPERGQGHATLPPSLLRRGMEKFLVGNLKATSNIGLNPKNQVSTSNGMAVTEI